MSTICFCEVNYTQIFLSFLFSPPERSDKQVRKREEEKREMKQTDFFTNQVVRHTCKISPSCRTNQ